jgi:hypothetical protein
MKHAKARSIGRPEKPVEILLAGRKDPTPVILQPSSAIEDADAVGHAIKAAKAQGAEPRPGSQVYDTARWAFLVAKTYLDADSPPGAREHFFETVGEAESIGTESIAYLFQLQQVWQEEAFPGYLKMSPAALVAAYDALAEETGDVFFSRLSAAMQVCCATSMAVLLRSSRRLRSPTGGPDTSGTTERSPRPEPPPKPPSRARAGVRSSSRRGR